MSMIEARGLTRHFKTRTGLVEAVRGVDFHVADGELVGFLGPNGAGKTTTQRMLATLLAPTAGEATVAGRDLRRDPTGVRRAIGYVAQGGATNPSAAVDEELVVQARLYGLSADEGRRRARALRDHLDLADLGERLIKQLSGGQRRRLDIALGMIHEPRLIFLDEPSTGLDPHSRANLWGHIRGLRDRAGTTIFLTTHYLDEADALCDRILIIDHGQIVAAGTPAELKRRISGDLVTLEVGDAAAAERARALLADRDGVRDVTIHDAAVRVTVEQGDAAALVLMRALDDAGLAVASLRVAHPTLDDVFLTLTGRSLRDAEADASGASHVGPA
ncbi:MAG: ATP-binding cassette domain-containing protein [Myxococcales bacterium]|nr:ATP-binding cassette domain-containing protein [Myxococcales bacterium]